MLGVIAGDIIGSPYRNNPVADSTSIFFPLFSTSDKVIIDQQRKRARTVSYEARPGIISSLAEAAADWCLRTDKTAEDWAAKMEDHLGDRHPTGVETLAVVGPIVNLSEGENDALKDVATVVNAMKPYGDVTEAAMSFARLLSHVRKADNKEELKSLLEGEGYNVSRNCSEIRPFITGTVVELKPGKLGIGDGKTVVDAAQVLPAALAAFLESDSYEEAVRRAVAVGGDSSLTAALAGAMGERRWGVPEHIRSKALDFLHEEDRALVNSYDRVMKARQGIEGEEALRIRIREANGTGFSVIRMDGYHPVYVIPEDRKDIEAAVRKINRNLGSDFEIIRPDALDAKMASMAEQKDADGVLLSGTYVEHPRPEVRPLWFQECRVRSAVTRGGDAVGGGRLPKVSVRQDTFNRFNGLKEYAENVRRELEMNVRWQGAPGEHIHFANAFYPVVLDNSIELRQGDILRARVGLDNDGKFRVDTNAMTGSNMGEYLEGAMNNMNVIEKNADMNDVKLMLDRYCLDYGKIPDDAERQILDGKGLGDESEVDSIKMKYRSNVDVAMDDMQGDLRVAVMPALSGKDMQAAVLREERRRESAERYQGMTHEEVLDSQRHKGSVFTVGHSNMAREELDGLLRRHGIEVVVDCRSFTKSSYAPQYNRDGVDGLEAHFDEAGMEYHHVPELGAHRYEGKGDDRRRLSFEEIQAQPEFHAKIRAIREGAKQGLRIALLSSESDPYDSHRFALLGRELAHPSDGRVKPVDVQHITRKGYVISQDYLENKMLNDYAPAVGGNGLDDMSGNESNRERLKEAFQKKGEVIVNRKDQPKRISLRQNAEEKAGKGQKEARKGPKFKR